MHACVCLDGFGFIYRKEIFNSFNLFVSILSSRRMDKLTIVYSTGHV